jgi:hypothetical protein
MMRLVACKFVARYIYIFFVWEEKKKKSLFYLAVVAGVDGGPSDVHPVAPGVVQLLQPHEAEHLHAIHQRVISSANGSGRGQEGRRKCTLSRHRPLTIAVGKRAATPRTASRICTGRDTEEDVKQNNSL